ncbi:unnamed protein product, partial [Rotaria sp. Silwood2]
CCCCESCMQQVTVECPPGQIIGTVQQEASVSGMQYVIKDENNMPMVTIMGPCCICSGIYSCGCENKYTVIPLNLDAKMKVLALAALFLIVSFTVKLVQCLLMLFVFFNLLDIGNYQIIRRYS